MTEPDPGPQLQEEPQSERGATGSRDEGAPPGAGDRPDGRHGDEGTGVNEHDTNQPAGQHSGDQGV